MCSAPVTAQAALAVAEDDVADTGHPGRREIGAVEAETPERQLLEAGSYRHCGHPRARRPELAVAGADPFRDAVAAPLRKRTQRLPQQVVELLMKG